MQDDCSMHILQHLVGRDPKMGHRSVRIRSGNHLTGRKHDQVLHKTEITLHKTLHKCSCIDLTLFQIIYYLLVHLEQTHGDVAPEVVSWAVGKDAQLGDDHGVKDLKVQADRGDVGRHQLGAVRNAQYGHFLPGN